MSTVTVRLVTSVKSVGREAWDACANPFAGNAPADTGLPDAPAPSSGIDPDTMPDDPGPDVEAQTDHPFVSYDFLHALEASGSVGPRTGWTPLHLVAEDDDGLPIGILPAYGKTHSQGEYVFDWGWADAYERAGGSYYPKLQVSVPFTPATGRRFLIRPSADADRIREALVQAARAALKQIEGSSIHMTFLGRRDWERLGQAGFLQRTDQQFHWINEGYSGFDDFLAALASRKRKTIKRERRDALEGGLSVERLTGEAISEEAWDAFWTFYQDTGSRKWGRPYLTRRFYRTIAETMADRVLLVMVRRAGRYVAGAINFIGSDTLYGRHWGCIEQHPFLHFEVCYHQAIEFAIERGLKRVEAGAQGEHKLARGYRPVTTYSAHFIADPRLRRAIEDYLRQERAQVAETHELLEDAGPFRRGEPSEQR